MKTLLNPTSIAAPLGLYTHGVLAPAGGNWLHVSGQVGVLPDGTVPEDFEEQTRTAWTNLIAVLEAAGMSVADLVKVTTYMTHSADLPRLGPVRRGFLGEARPASTLVVVQALARAEWKIEVEAVAFKGP